MSWTRSGADLLVESLERYGVSHVFGNPGTTELPVLDAIGRSDLEYVLAPHEDVAVGAAAGYGTVRRDHLFGDRDASGIPSAPADDWPHLPLGVANLHLVGGLAHGLGNLYGASMAGAPVLVTAGTHSLSFRHEEPILSGDPVRHADPYAEYAAEVTDVDALPAMVRRAVRSALTPPTGPAFLAIPMDVAEAATDADPEPLGAIPRPGPGDPAALDRAADLLAGAEDVVLLVGDGVARAGPGAVESAADFADAVGARVHGEALSAAVAFPRAHDCWGSVLPPDAGAIRERLDADAVVLAGCSTNTTLVRHDGPLLSGDPTLVHVGANADDLGKRHPADAAITGDPGAILGDLADRVSARILAPERRERRATAAEAAGAIRRDVNSQGTIDGGESDRTGLPTPATLVDAMEAAAPDALVVDEGVSAKYALLARWDLDPGDFHSNEGGCLGYGLPAAVGAAVAEAQRETPRPVLGFVGDGSYCYYPQAVRTAVDHGVDLTVVVPNNAGYGSVAAKAADLADADAADLPGLAFDPPVDAAANAESHGATGHRVEARADLADALESAVASDGVDVVDVRVED